MYSFSEVFTDSTLVCRCHTQHNTTKHNTTPTYVSIHVHLFLSSFISFSFSPLPLSFRYASPFPSPSSQFMSPMRKRHVTLQLRAAESMTEEVVLNCSA